MKEGDFPPEIEQEIQKRRRQGQHILHVQIADADDNYAPVERPTLRISRVGDDVFFSIGKLNENQQREEFRPTGQVVVARKELVAAFRLLEIGYGY